MQIVIDIPEEIKAIIDKNGTNEIVTETLWQAVKNGISLPKGHGRLIDADAVNERYYAIYNDAINCSNKPSDRYLLDKWNMCLDTTPIIIEADMAESEE